MPQSPPQAGEDIRELWKYVAKVVERVNAIENMKITVHSINPTTGTFEIHGDRAALDLN